MLVAFVVGNIFASVSDTTQILCPQNIAVYTDINECSALINNGLNIHSPKESLKNLTWELSGATIDASPGTGVYRLNEHTFNEGTTTVLYRETTRKNKTSTCSFEVVVSDNQLPRIINPSEVIYATANIGECNAVVKWGNPIVLDNCTPSNQILITGNYSSGSTFPVGTTEVQITISDGNNANNTTHSFLVVVKDEEMPVLVAPETITVNCGEGVPSAFTEWDDFQNAGGKATDNCNIDYKSFKYVDQKSTSIFCPYTITRTYSIADESGNITEVKHFIKVEGEEKNIDLDIKNTEPQNSTVQLKSALTTYIATQSGNWNDQSTWGNSGPPTSNDDVSIPSPYTVTITGAAECKDITIASGGTVQISGSQTLQVNGNWTNNGTFTPGTTGKVQFTGVGNVTISGTTTFEELIIDKGNLSTLITISGSTSISSGGSLTLTGGLITIPIGGSFAINPSSGLSIPNTAGFDITGGTLSTGNFTITNAGLIRISSGTATFGTASGNEVHTKTDGAFIVAGGTVDIAGRLYNSASGTLDPTGLALTSGITITGGTVTLCKVGNGESSTGSLNVTSAGNFIFTGGKIVFQKPSTAITELDLGLLSGAGTKNTTGGTFQFGNSSTPGGTTFNISSEIPLYNLITNVGANIELDNDLEITNQLTLDSGSDLILNDNTIQVPVSGTGTYNFPLDDGNGNSIPVAINFTAGNFSGASIELTTTGSKHPNNANTTNYLNRYWTITTNGITNPSYSVDADYTASDIINSPSNLKVSSYLASVWAEITGASISGNTISLSGTTSSLVFTALDAPTISITNAKPSVICSSSPITLNTTSSGDPIVTYSWTFVDNLNISGENTGSASSLTQTLTNNSITTQTVTYTVTITDGNGFTASDDIDVVVNPTPTMTSADTKTICSNDNINLSLTSDVPSSYSWVATANSNVTGESTTAQSGSTMNDVLVNTTNLVQYVTYTVTPTSTTGSCVGTPQTVTITVNPTPTLSTPLTATICTGVEFSYTPQSQVSGTTFSWIRKAALGINNIAASAADPGEINETLVNTTDTEKQVIYSYTLTANGCTNVQELVVTVSPAPLLSSNDNPPAVCSDDPFIYTATSAMSNINFTWSRASMAGISQPESLNNTGANINETLTNTTNADIDVAYEITMTTAAGCENTQTVWATIKPTPTVDSIYSDEYCAGILVPEVVVSGPVVNTSFTWTNDKPEIGLPGYGTGNIPSFTTTNNTNAPIVATIRVAPRARGCAGIEMVFKLTVYPSPEVTQEIPVVLCDGESSTGITFSTPTTGGTITYNWTSDIDVGFGTSGTGDIPAFTATNPNTATVSVTATDDKGCTGTDMQFTVTVNQLPDITTSPENPETCLGDSVEITASGADTYSWSPATGLSSTTGATVKASPATTTTYTITGIDANGCDNTTTVTVTVNPLPVISLSATSATICLGDSVEITASGADTYIWSPATGLSSPTGATVKASPDNTTTYTVIGTDNNGCDNSQTVTVNVTPLPTLTSTLTPAGICNGTAFQYTPTSATATTFIWRHDEIPNGSPENSDTIAVGESIDEILNLDVTETNSVSVVYTIIMETAGGCIDSAEVVVWVSPEPQFNVSPPPPPSICSGDTYTLNPTSNPGTTITWSRAAIAGISNPAVLNETNPVNEILINTTSASIDVDYVYNLNLNGCEREVTVTVTVLPGPQVTASTDAGGDVCIGEPFNLFSSSPVATPEVTLLDEDFEGSNSWTETHNDNWARWQIRNDNSRPYNGQPRIRSNDHSHFYITRSRYRNPVHTTLTSPSIDISSGYTSLILDFYHYFRYRGNGGTETAKVEVSTDNTNWTTVSTYTSTQGARRNFDHVTIDLSSYVSGSATNLYIRFKYDASRDYYWAIDNVTVKGSVTPTIAWTSVPAGFTSSEANPTNVTQTENTTYYVRYTFPASMGYTCDGVASVTVNTLDDTEDPVIHDMPGNVLFECGDCIQAFDNADFEDDQSIACWAYVPPGGVPGWRSTTSTGVIELQRSGCVNGVTSQSGNYHAELNADRVGDLYQEFCTVPTTSVRVSFWHHKRVSSNNTTDDIMGVWAGPNLSSLTQIYTATATNASGWTQHFVTLNIPAGQTSTVFVFRAIQGAPGGNGLTYGNLIDNIQAVTLFNPTDLPYATDNCNPAPALSLVEQRVDGSCGMNYELFRTWTATDAAGNSTSETQVVTVGDFEPPVLTITPENPHLTCGEIANSSITITDNCVNIDDVTVKFIEEIKFDSVCPNKYTLRRSWSAEDLCSNIDTFYQFIYYDDTTPPAFTYCPPNATLTCTQTNNETATATDGCGAEPVITFTDDTIVGACIGEMTINRIWIATDDCGNADSCYQTITTVDNTQPEWVTAANSLDTTIDCDNSAALTIAQALFPEATDDCGSDVSNIVKVPGDFVPGSCGEAGTYTNKWAVTDDCGNVSDTFIQVITLIDTVAPVWTTTAHALDTTLDCGDAAALTAAQNLFPVATDNCDGDVSNVIKTAGSLNVGSCPSTGTYTNTWTVTDDCGNTSETFTQVITIIDTIAPGWNTIEGALNVFISCDDAAGLATAMAMKPTPEDNCDTDPDTTKTSNDFVEGICPHSGTYTNTWSITDACGNVGEIFTQIITIEDYTEPDIVCPPNVTINYGESTDPADRGYATATDNCDPDPDITFTNDTIPGNCVYKFEIVRTWLAEDACGNKLSCKQSIYVQDIEEPAIACTIIGDTIVEANTGDTYLHADTGWDAIITDNSNHPIIEVVLTGNTTAGPFTTLNGVTFNEGITTVTWTASDSCGNVADPCSYTVTVNASADLEIDKTAMTTIDDNNGTPVQYPDEAFTGEELIYTITVTNNGPSAATNAEITDAITAFSNPEYALALTGPWAAWTGTYTLPAPLGVNNSYSIYIRGDVSENQCDDIDNTASVSSDKIDHDITNNKITITTPVVDTIPPTFTTAPFEDCVDYLFSAVYAPLNPDPVEGNDPNLIKNPSPDYRTFPAGDTSLDILTLDDNCCDPASMTIHWRIDFTDTPNNTIPAPHVPYLSFSPISGTGQPSTYGSDIHFPGDGVLYQPVIHTITYWVIDCHGNRSPDHVETITINPRPLLIKMN